MSLQDILGLVLGAGLTVIGGISGIFIRDLWLARAAEARTNERQLSTVLRKYRGPLLLATGELIRRIEEINADFPPAFLSDKSAVFEDLPRELSARVDEHFDRYKRISTLYRIAAFWGWVECFRLDSSYLHMGETGFSRDFERLLNNVRQWFSDGGKNPDWAVTTIKDALIYREELRAIGELMHPGPSDRCSVIGYAEFCSRLADDPKFRWWLDLLNGFFDELSAENDFRCTRFNSLARELTVFRDFLLAAKTLGEPAR